MFTVQIGEDSIDLTEKEDRNTKLLFSTLGNVIIILHCSENLAQEKPTDQSSLYDFQYASIAVNGKKLNIHCTHTRASTKPWWKVDLEQVVPVSEVFILNRGDCCGERLNGAEIRVGEYL